jgi:macrolide-specific efflux system membrane fusion protein
MTPEQRAAYRESRKTAREANGRETAGSDTQDGKQKEQSAVGDTADVNTSDDAEPTAENTGARSGGFTDQNNAHRSRKGTVKVIASDGQIEQREVQVGVTNRVQMQILNGLTEGDEVVVGLKLPPSTARAQNARGSGGLGQQPTRGMR